MAEYIKNKSNERTIKVGVMNDMYFSRKTLLRFKQMGYQGFASGKFNDNLNDILSDEDTLYTFKHEPEYIEWDLKSKLFFIPANKLTHDTVTIANSGYQYKSECQEANKSIIKARLFGERYRNGVVRTIFRCDCCYKEFSIDHITSQLLRNLLPVHKAFFNSEYSGGKEDLGLIETLELVADRCNYEDFLKLIRNGDTSAIEGAIKQRGYNNFYDFYEHSSKFNELEGGEVDVDGE